MTDITLVPDVCEQDHTFVTETDLSAKQYYFVKHDTNEKIVLCGAGDAPLGILQNKPNGTAAAPALATVRMPGALSKLKLAGTVTQASYIKSDADGKGVATTSANDECGAKSITSAESGDLAAVQVFNARY